MSHFSVCVAIPAGCLPDGPVTESDIVDILDSILEPFDESSTNDEYLEFVDRTRDCRDKYKQYLDEERVSGRHPGKTKYSSFEDYCTKYFGYEEIDGSWGYYSNPNAKLDWFCVGGRFSGEFLTNKPMPDQTADSSDVIGSKFAAVNGGRMSDIAWEEMRKRELHDAKRSYYKLSSAFSSGSTNGLGSLARIVDDGICEPFSPNYLFKSGESLEEYMDRTGAGRDDLYPMCLYAFVDLDGVWHSQEDMGWFGISANDKDERVWHDEIQRFFGSLHGNDYVVTVDCHI